MLDHNNSGIFFTQTNSEANSEFVNRQKSVFENLDALVKDSERHINTSNPSKRNLSVREERKLIKKQKCDMREFRGQESIFKRPEAPPPSRFMKSIPDFQKNPNKWTRYTLSDVTQDDMSEQSNTAAAMSFLRELKAKKDAEDMDTDGEVKAITFKKPSNYTKNKPESDSEKSSQSTSFRSSKVVMPEYVVGEKKQQKKTITTKSTVKGDKSKEIKLGHLLEEDDDEEC